MEGIHVADQVVASVPETAALSERRRFLAFLTVLTGVVLEVADSTIVNTALPAIRQALHASPQEMQWIVAGYLLALGSLLLLGGRLGDAFGHARVFLWGVGGFILASALCGMAQDPLQLVMARVVQGAAGAIMAPQTMAVVQLLYTPLERVTRLAYFGVILGLAAILGPILGGVLIELDLFGLGWRTIFLINVPIGLGVILMGRVVLPRAEDLAPPKIDALGALLFTASFGSLLYALIEAAERGWSLLLALLGVAGAALLVIGWQRAGRRRAAGLASVLEPSLFAIPTFRWATWAGFGFAAASMGYLLVFAVSLQQGLGLSALDTALVHIPFGAGVMLGVGFLVPRLLPRFGKAVPLTGGLVMIAGTTASLALIAAGHGNDALLLAVMGVAGAGMGLLSGPLGPIVVAQVPREHAGTASATFRTAQQIGGAGGIALVGAAYFSVAGSDAASNLAGTWPASLVVAVLLLWAVFAVARLPRTLFAG
jgi:EmrB/QacA subfamily drug resistance transporter